MITIYDNKITMGCDEYNKFLDFIAGDGKLTEQDKQNFAYVTIHKNGQLTAQKVDEQGYLGNSVFYYHFYEPENDNFGWQETIEEILDFAKQNDIKLKEVQQG